MRWPAWGFEWLAVLLGCAGGLNKAALRWVHVDTYVRGLGFMMLGGPLVTEQGELAAVAVGHFWDSRLYCPADSLRKMMHGVVGLSE